MIISSVIGAQIGVIIANKTNTDKLRSILALMIIGICIKMLLDLFSHPISLFTVEAIK
jgi:hypothetical protein